MSTKYNGSLEFPNNSEYILRCIEEKFGPSNGGNPMITLKFEMVTENAEINGEQVNIAGIQIPYYRITKNMEGDVVDTEKTARSEKDTIKLFNAFGLDSSALDFSNPTLGFRGKSVYAMVVNDPQDRRKTPTAEQLKKGQKQGDVMINPVTKQPLKFNKPKIAEIFGLAEAVGSGAV